MIYLNWYSHLIITSSFFLYQSTIILIKNTVLFTVLSTVFFCVFFTVLGWRALHIAVFEIKGEIEIEKKAEDKANDNKGSGKDVNKVYEKGPLMAVCPLYVKYNRWEKKVENRYKD